MGIAIVKQVGYGETDGDYDSLVLYTPEMHECNPALELKLYYAQTTATEGAKIRRLGHRLLTYPTHRATWCFIVLLVQLNILPSL